MHYFLPFTFQKKKKKDMEGNTHMPLFYKLGVDKVEFEDMGPSVQRINSFLYSQEFSLIFNLVVHSSPSPSESLYTSYML